jgi:CheY-like chemotaxis protein
MPEATTSVDEVAREAGAPEFKIPDPILIVEDSVDTLDMLQVFFIQHQCRVLSAKSAKEAIEMAATDKPGLIISDIGMPDQSGYDMLAHLRRQPGLEKVPAIAVSGFAMDEDRDRAIGVGFSAHLAKPVDLEKLLIIIRDITR